MSAASSRILIVDDSREDRMTLRRHLEADRERAYLVSEAASGAEGLVRCRSEAPDCVLLDYNLPDLDGIEFLEKLQHEFDKDAPAVVMLTGHGNENVAVSALKRGAQDYLVKSLNNPGGVRHAIHTAISTVRLRRTVTEQRILMERLSAERANLLEQLQERAAMLSEADHRKDAFLATLAHELRNPLAAINASLQVLERSGIEEAHRGMLDILHRQTHHMVRLVDDLMEVSRITRGRIELRLADLELASVLQAAVEANRPMLEAARHQLSVSVPDAAVHLRGDDIRLTQIFANLLNNAAKYTDPGGSIWLTAAQAGDEVTVSIRDNGTGIPAEMLPRVFDLFTQVDRTLGRAQGGLGIGLTLAKQLSELHGGRIEVRSEGINKGSEFVVRLPLGSHASDAPRERKPPEPARPALRRVLVVDDSVDAADSLAQVLRLLGADVYVAHDGVSALSACHSYRPAAVILDIGMPGMDGYALAAQIRKQECFQAVVLIALTGWGQPQDRSRSHEAGFDHHLVKPADFAVLQEMLGLAQPA